MFLVLPRTYNPATQTYGNLYSDLLDYIISAALIFYILTIAGVFRLRIKKPNADRPYRAFGYPWLPALYIIGAAAILIVLFTYRPATTWPGLIIVISACRFIFSSRALPKTVKCPTRGCRSSPLGRRTINPRAAASHRSRRTNSWRANPVQFARMISAVDAHACGEPGRVIVGGVLDVPGATMFEKMKYLETRADDLRKLMLREPRGYPASNCNLILPSTNPEAAAGFVIMEQWNTRLCPAPIRSASSPCSSRPE